MSKTSISGPFQGASAESPPAQDGFRYFHLFIASLFGDYSDAAEFNKLVEEIYGVSAEINEADRAGISELRDLFTSADDSEPTEENTADYEAPRASVYTHPARKMPLADATRKYTGRLDIFSGPTALDPKLVEAMDTKPDIKEYVEFTTNLARQYNLDGNMLANQFWQESRYNPNAKSHAGAKGIAQFIPGTAADYEIAGKEYNPHESMIAGARYMSDLTKKFGDQRLAMVAYNGGGGALKYVKESLGKDITIGDWMNFMAEQRRTLGVGASNLWRNQTFDYVQKIDSNFWDAGKRDMALEKMAMAGLVTSAPEKMAYSQPELTTMGG